MKKRLLLILPLSFLISCAHHKKASEKEIDIYCQDLNILYQKQAVIESNIANIHTTSTSEGGYYKRQIAEECWNGFCKILIENKPPILKYEPNYPDANKQGYVAYPNINFEQEKYDLKQWSNVFENVVKFAPINNSFFLKDENAYKCFEKYPFVNEKNNYRKYLGR